MENAILSSLHKGSSLKYRIDNVILNTGELSAVNLNKILKEASSLGIRDITIFNESGKVFVAIEGNKKVAKKEASIEELKMINTAITKQSFEDKLFCHKIHKKDKKIDLFIPFTYKSDQNGIAAIALEMKDINRQYGYLIRQCIVMAILIIIIHILFALVIFKMLIIPLRTLIGATQSISRGKLDIRVPIVGQDEIGQLASSFNEMSVAFQRMRDEAKGANPLTGLPGNITIARYIDECLTTGSVICVLYCDLDNFKSYNDKYGFTKGDEAIIYSRDCLNAVAQRKDMQNIFVGHEGGDDFVVVTPYDLWEPFAKAFITTFDRGIYQFYNSVDARNGFIESVNRQGQRQRFPLISVSIAVVTNKTRPFRRHAEMIQVAAEVKKYVKSLDGSCYAIDRRTGSVGPRTETPANRSPENPAT
jgi:GGDEF domain-containing protein